jgi:Tat protein secretion system quality control protein TatD with DNase activity
VATKELCLVDGHAHLEELNDLPKSLQDAKEAGVIGIIGVGMDVESNQKILQIAGANTRYVYPALGYHPWQIKEKEVEANLSFIRDHVQKAVALGEIGNQTGTDREDLTGDRYTRKLSGERGKAQRCARILGGSSSD